MESQSNSVNNSDGLGQTRSTFPDEALEIVLSFIDSHKDRNSVSLVCNDWYNAERWTRSKLFIGNCYSVSPEIVARRFRRIKSVTLKGKPRCSDIKKLQRDWGGNVHSWLVMFAKVYPFLEELRLKRMIIRDECLELLAKSFTNFKALSLSSCHGFSGNGLKAIASHCWNLTELDLQNCLIDDGGWLSCFPENFASLKILNLSSLNDKEVNFDALKGLICRCKSLRVLKAHDNLTLNQLQQLLVHIAPQLVELGIGSHDLEQLTHGQYEDIKSAFNNCTRLQILSGLWDATSFYLPHLHGVCARLTFFNLIDVGFEIGEFPNLIVNCPNLRRLWEMPRLNVEVIQDYGSDESRADTVYVYRSVAGPRRDAPPIVLTL